MASADSPFGGVKIALTVDDLFQWKGVPPIKGYEPTSIVRCLTDAFAGHAVSGVYAFSNTAPIDDQRSLARVFDHWTERGHFTGNHTHNHASLNWLTPKAYIDDIERTERLIAVWTAQAPVLYFRHCFDMWGDTLEKQEAVAAYLQRTGYAVAPISLWFYDAQFCVPYLRAMQCDDHEALSWLRKCFVETACKQLATQTAAARLMFGRDPAHIWLIHGTPIASDCIGEILDAFAARGVQFISLDEAMRDPMNQQQPLVTPLFRNQVQKWAETKGVAIEDTPPAILKRLDDVCPLPGMSGDQLFSLLLSTMATGAGAEVDLSKFRLDI